MTKRRIFNEKTHFFYFYHKMLSMYILGSFFQKKVVIEYHFLENGYFE